VNRLRERGAATLSQQARRAGMLRATIAALTLAIVVDVALYLA